MRAPWPPSAAGGKRCGLVHRTHHERGELLARFLHRVAFRLQRLRQLGVRQLPLLGGAAGDENHVSPRLPRQRSVARKPAPHPLLARIVGGGREPEIAELLVEVGQKACRMNDSRLRLEWIVEPAIRSRAGHELGDALRAFRADGIGIEAALPPDQPHERHRRQPPRLSLRLHQRTHRVHERLRPRGGKTRSLDARRHA